MKYSTMLAAAGAILILGTVGSRTLESQGITRKNGLFFLLGIMALRGFTIEPAEGVTLNAACLLFVVSVSAFVFLRGRRLRFFICVLLAALAGTAGFLPIEREVMLMLVLAAAVPVSLGVGAGPALVFCALAPMFAAASEALDFALKYGLPELDVGEPVLASQLAGCMLALGVQVLKQSVRTGVRWLSDERPT